MNDKLRIWFWFWIRHFTHTLFSSNIDEVIRSVLKILLFFYDKISQVQKSIKKNTRHSKALKNTTINIDEVIRLVSSILAFFQDTISQVRKRIKTVHVFYVKCRLKFDLELFTYIYFYLKVTVKKFLTWLLIRF